MLHKCSNDHWFASNENGIICPYCKQRAIKSVEQRTGDCIKCSALCPDGAYACSEPEELKLEEEENGQSMIVDGIEVSYRLSGKKSKNLILFLQGWATTKDIYNELADYLSRYSKVLQFDFPGFGETPQPSQPWSVRQYATFTNRLLESFDFENLIIVAHSFGGRVAIELASDQSLCNAKIERMFFIDVAGCKLTDTSKTIKNLKYKAVKNMVNLPGVYQMFPELVDEWKSNQGSEDYRRASETMRGVLVQAVNYDQTELLEKIDVPVNLIWGANDQDTPVRIAEVMNDKIASSTLDVIENTGHFPFIDNKKAVCEIFERYLSDSR